jgi:hypothetical protein
MYHFEKGPDLIYSKARRYLPRKTPKKYLEI